MSEALTGTRARLVVLDDVGPEALDRDRALAFFERFAPRECSTYPDPCRLPGLIDTHREGVQRKGLKEWQAIYCHTWSTANPDTPEN